MAARDDDIVTRYYCQVIMIEMRQSINLTQRNDKKLTKTFW